VLLLLLLGSCRPPVGRPAAPVAKTRPQRRLKMRTRRSCGCVVWFGGRPRC